MNRIKLSNKEKQRESNKQNCCLYKTFCRRKEVCQELCEAYIPKLLKSPSTAKFCKDSDYEFSKENGIIKAQGYVDAQNSFGAIIRSNFLLTYDAVKKVPVSLIFDGTKFTF